MTVAGIYIYCVLLFIFRIYTHILHIFIYMWKFSVKQPQADPSGGIPEEGTIFLGDDGPCVLFP
jgi:hypothetical protein